MDIEGGGYEYPARKTDVRHFNAVTSTAATVARAVVTERDVERLRVLFRR